MAKEASITKNYGADTENIFEIRVIQFELEPTRYMIEYRTIYKFETDDKWFGEWFFLDSYTIGNYASNRMMDIQWGNSERLGFFLYYWRTISQHNTQG